MVRTATPNDENQQNEENELRELLEGYDTERRVSELRQLEVTLVGTDLYFPAATKSTMDSNNGAPVLAVHTKTFKDEKKVTFFPCSPTAPGARKIRLGKTMGCGYMGFSIPLAKLELSFPEERRITLTVNPRKVKDLWVYDISFQEFENEKRNLGAQGQTRQQRSRRKNEPDEVDEAEATYEADEDAI